MRYIDQYLVFFDDSHVELQTPYCSSRTGAFFLWSPNLIRALFYIPPSHPKVSFVTNKSWQQQQLIQRISCSPGHHAAGDAPVVCSKFLGFTTTTITTAYSLRALPAFSMVIVLGLNIPAILGLDVLAAGRIVIDPTLSDIWHLDDIRLRTRNIVCSRPINWR